MPTNTVIEISSVAELDIQLNLPNRALFLVLGDTGDHKQLIGMAASVSQDWRYTLYAKDPRPLFDRLYSLPLRLGVLPIAHPWPPEVMAVSISFTNYICRCVTDTKPNSVAAAFLLAETFMQP